MLARVSLLRLVYPGGGGGGGTLIISYIRRLGSFFWVQNIEFQYFWGFSGKLIFILGMKILWIYLGVITKLGVISIHHSIRVMVQNGGYFFGLLKFHIFFGVLEIPVILGGEC